MRALCGARGTADALETAARADVVLDRVGAHIARRPVVPHRDVPLAGRPRALLDEHVVEGVSLDEAATARAASRRT